MNFNSPKSEPKKSFEKLNAKKSEKDKIASKPDQKPYDKPKNKIEPRKIDPNKEPKHKIQCRKLDPNAPTRHKIEPRKINPKIEPKHKLHPRKIDPNTPPRHKIKPPKFDPKAPTRNKIEHPKIDLKAPPRNKIERPKFDPKAPPRNKIQQQFDTNKLDIDHTPSIQSKNNDISKLEEIKEKIKNFDWESISDDWNITTRSNQYAEYNNISLDPTKDVSKENPLYRNKEWLDKVYNSKNWKLNDKDIANLCGVHPSVIGKWRKKHQISRKLQGEGRWTDKRSGKVYVRVPQDYDHPELTKRPGIKSVYRLEHIYNIEKYLSRHPELELSKKYLVAGKYLKIGTKVNYINQDSKDNSVENLKINTNIVKPVERENYLRREKDIDHTPSNQNIKNNTFKLEKIKEEIKNIDWKSISENWSLTTRSNQYSKALDPTKNSSLENPLYRNKEWLNNVYNNKNWNLTDKKIANLCGVNPFVITQWRKRHQIARKEGNWVNISKSKAQGRWLNLKTGRVCSAMSKDYMHPELKPLSGGGYIRPEHTFKMEKYLANNPQLEISKKYLIQGKYLKKGIEIHHINQIKQDNRIKNLWIYENKKEHARGELTLYDTLKTHVSTNQIVFKDGKYAINQDFKSSKSHQQQIEKPINYKDMNLVKEEIKKIDWNSISNEWSVQVKKNQFVQKTVKVDPTRDCSKDNPLHHHKEWFQRLVSDNRFNLTDSRLAKLCGITRDTARYWRDRMHGIKGKTEWGFERRVDDKDGRIWIKVPKDYANPVVQKEDHHRRIMLEHRYVIEQHLAKHPELEISKKCLINGKYLKPEAHVHHINLDYQDNRIENLWVFENVKEHNVATKSLYNLVESLFTKELIGFKNGKYYIN